MDVAKWLGQLGLSQYQTIFAENGIDAEVLRQLTAEDLKELGVDLLGHRRKLLNAIEALRSEVESTAPAVPAEAPSSVPAQPAAGPQRRHLTVLFCDLVGSTALSAQLDPEDLRAVIRRYHAAVAEVVRSQGGFVAQYLGDGALVYFGFPVAHEDDAERAVRAALLLREVVQAIDVKGAHLEVRAGPCGGGRSRRGLKGRARAASHGRDTQSRRAAAGAGGARRDRDRCCDSEIDRSHVRPCRKRRCQS
jgi:hypothetical protein